MRPAAGRRVVRSSPSRASFFGKGRPARPTTSTSTALTNGSGAFTAWPSRPASRIGAAVAGAPLAAHLGVQPGESLLLRIGSGEDIPGESLYGRRDGTTRTIRLTCGGIAGPAELGEFALRSGQGSVFSLFVPLSAAAARTGAAGSRQHHSHCQRIARRRDPAAAKPAARTRRANGRQRPFPAPCGGTGRRRSKAPASCWTMRSPARRSRRPGRPSGPSRACSPTLPTPSALGDGRSPTA